MDRRLNYIKQNPNKSGNQIIDSWKNTPLAIRRKDGFKLVRQTRDIKPISNRKKYIPIKYREQPIKGGFKKPEIELPKYPEKDGYYVAKIEIKKGVDKGKKYFIYYQDEKHLQEQKNKILSSYGHSFEDIKISFHGFKASKPFIDADFDLSFLEI